MDDLAKKKPGGGTGVGGVVVSIGGVGVNLQRYFPLAFIAQSRKRCPDGSHSGGKNRRERCLPENRCGPDDVTERGWQRQGRRGQSVPLGVFCSSSPPAAPTKLWLSGRWMPEV